MIKPAVAVAVLAAAVVLSLVSGARPVGWDDLSSMLAGYDPTDPAQVVLRDIRLPRLVAGLVAGGALGLAGMVMQTITRNPLADPGLLGVNAGAALSLLIGGILSGHGDAGVLSLMTLPGAAMAAAVVFVLGGGVRGNADPVRLTLAGAAMNALLLSLVGAIVMIRRESLDVFRFWSVGSLAEAASRPLVLMTVVAACGALIALAIAPRIEALSLGGALARGLGTRPGRVQAAALVAVTCATGAAVAIAGPIAFLGLIVPPLVSRTANRSLRMGLVMAAVMGAAILLGADAIGRIVMPPAEVRAGIMTALLGAPAFIIMARRLRPGSVA